MAQSWGEDIVLALHPKFSALPLVNPPPTKKLSGQKHPNHPNSQPELAPLPQSQALVRELGIYRDNLVPEKEVKAREDFDRIR